MLCIFVKRQIMKYIIKLIFLITLVGVFLACDNKQEDIVPQLSIAMSSGDALDGASLSFAGEGGADVIAIDTNSSWSIGCSAEWISFSSTDGHGPAEIEISVTATEISRSAVVIVYVPIDERIRASFNIVQHAPMTSSPDDSPEDTPDDTPSQEPDDSPEDTPDDTPTQEPEDSPEDTPDDAPSQEPDNSPEDTPDDAPSQEPDDAPEDTPDDAPSQEPDDEPNTPEGGNKPDTPIVTYTKIVDMAELRAGTYYIGGYQGDVLHLATAGISTGHLHTTPFSYNEADGTLLSSNGVQAVEVCLEATGDSNTFYLNFVGEGYLMATKNSAGALTFTDEPQAMWQFKQGDGGLELCQMGDIYVKLIISRRAADRLLRSIDGDEDDGNPILLFCKN